MRDALIFAESRSFLRGTYAFIFCRFVWCFGCALGLTGPIALLVRSWLTRNSGWGSCMSAAFFLFVCLSLRIFSQTCRLVHALGQMVDTVEFVYSRR